jgi:hypothetical protein
VPEAGKHLHLYAPEIRIRGIKWKKLFYDKKLKIKSLKVDSPDITVREIPVDSSAKEAPPISEQKDAPALEVLELEFEKLKLEAGCLEFLQPLRRKGEVATATAGSVNISLTDLKFNLQADVVTAPTMKKANLKLHGIEVDLRGHSHRFTLDSFELDKKDSLIAISGLRLQPNDSPAALFAKSKYKKAWLDISLKQATVSGWEFKRLLKEGRFVAQAIRLTGLDLRVRTNQNLLHDPNGYKPMPQEMLAKAGLPILVDSLLVEEGSLRFENVGKGKSDFGTLEFAPLTATITNLTNDSARIAQQKTMVVDVHGNCQREHHIANTFWFNLASPDHAFRFKGSAADLPFASLNSFIKPCANVAFEGGIINKLSFEASGNAKTVAGKMNMEYEGLDFALLDQDHQKRKLLTRVVDLFFVDEDNDRGGDAFNKGEIRVQRNPRKSFLNYWWLAIQSGIKTSLLEDEQLEKIERFTLKRKQRRKEKHS